MHIGTKLYWNGNRAYQILPDGSHIKTNLTFDEYVIHVTGVDTRGPDRADNRVSPHPHTLKGGQSSN